MELILVVVLVVVVIIDKARHVKYIQGEDMKDETMHLVQKMWKTRCWAYVIWT